ncbi:MAG: DUF4118 domain-containing protein [bacterium]
MISTQQNGDSIAWSVAGALGAVLLAVLLIPLRGVTSASNMAFAFIALTIVVAEQGGRLAGVLTALVSGISLNFFLTEPYLTLNITRREDVIAFIALLGCGLIAAAFGRERQRWSEKAHQAAEKLDVLSRLVDQLRRNEPIEKVLSDLRDAFALGAIVLRDENDRILAAHPPTFPRLAPETRLHPATLFPSEEAKVWMGKEGFRLPPGGGRLSLKTDRGSISIDLWEGNPEGLSLDKGRTLSIAALILVLELSCRQG